MIEYLAARTGHRCIRINNHEHTDTQEYIGGYTTTSEGLLEFRDGLLVEALRGGHWIILDELNLAPSDVLEALNRLLDDNKELFIPETGETVTPAEGFVLFATQNPPGLYGGRKPLSRAFRNRFLELAVCDLPSSEIQDIITHSCGIAPKFSKMLVDCMSELSVRRQQSSLFQGKLGSVTTRDLIKWGKRCPLSPAAVARDGFMLLAERLRDDAERAAVQVVLEKVCGVKIDPASLYEEMDGGEGGEEDGEKRGKNKGASRCDALMTGPGEGVVSASRELRELCALQASLRSQGRRIEGIAGVAITSAMKRMWVLTSRCIQHNEPVLLVGTTGCGKTTVCQLLASRRNQRLVILNCHQSSETSDIIGGLRPVRNRQRLLSDAVASLQGALAHISALRPLLEPARCEGVDEALTAAAAALSGDAASARSAREARDALAVVHGVVLAALAAPAPDAASASSSSAGEAAQPAGKATKKARTKGGASSSATKSSGGGGSDPEGNSELAALAVPAAQALTAASTLLSRHTALFEWVDGPLVEAMKEGHMLLLDEINLADDAVIERLNSVLEPGRSITLAEKGGSEAELERITAHPDFKFLATMNPGGDFGKRELSPALRSRFTEVWASTSQSEEDLVLIVAEVLRLPAALASANTPACGPQALARVMVAFAAWINAEAAARGVQGVRVATREVLAWAKFLSISLVGASSSGAAAPPSSPADADAAVFSALMHGALMVILDGLGLGSSSGRAAVHQLVDAALKRLFSHCPAAGLDAVRASIAVPSSVVHTADALVVGAFAVPKAAQGSSANTMDVDQPSSSSSSYVLSARSTLGNLARILRGMQLPRPILLEGPPGVGKSSIISNLAALTGNTLVRINLSEFSELSDLLGTDLPTAGDEEEEQGQGQGGGGATAKFKWCDGMFLTAMKQGHWVLLDELNLAPQTVLEGLNACFDHREEVFIPEIGQTVRPGQGFRVFCAQNPMVEGGGRKGLPDSYF
jgi:midasin